MKRRAKYKNKTAAQLQIYIDLATSGEILTYEDNAGGVEEDNLTNLVVPGFSETNAIAQMGSDQHVGLKQEVEFLLNEFFEDDILGCGEQGEEEEGAFACMGVCAIKISRSAEVLYSRHDVSAPGF